MKEDNFGDILREIMTKFDKARTLWVKRYGTDTGFNEWFTKQIINLGNKE